MCHSTQCGVGVNMCVLLVNTAFHNFELVTEVKVYFEKKKKIFIWDFCLHAFIYQELYV